MDNALDLVRELRARTKEACINPDCQDGHMCNVFGECCNGCYATGTAIRHLSNLRIAYFETLVEVLERQCERIEYGGNSEWCEVHDAIARPDRYHDERCSKSRNSRECRFRSVARAEPTEVLADIKKVVETHLS